MKTQKLLHVTEQMSGKMEEMSSISTSSLDNPFCIKMSKNPNAICAECYSNDLLKMYKTARNRFKLNADYLSSTIHPVDDMPRLNKRAVRFNAFGELINYEHFVNLMNICRKNPDVTFTLWTKLHGIVHKGIRDWGKPKNLILIYSSPITNVRGKLPQHFDKVFTVYDDTKKLPRGQKINCGETRCIDCMACYTLSDRKTYINEMVKRKQKRKKTV